jgi:hypothetical protein
MLSLVLLSDVTLTVVMVSVVMLASDWKLMKLEFLIKMFHRTHQLSANFTIVSMPIMNAIAYNTVVLIKTIGYF